MDTNKDNGLDFEEFLLAVHRPTPIVEWAATLPLPELIADAIPRKEGCSDPLRSASLLKDDEIEVVCEEISRRLKDMLQEYTSKLQKSFTAMDENQRRNDAAAKFEVVTLNCGKIDDFYAGLGGRVGSPSLDFRKAMEAEHCTKHGHNLPFETSNYHISTYPEKEWSIVVNQDMAMADMSYNRRLPKIEELVNSSTAQTASLRDFEVIAVVLYTGPMFHLYNTVLRRAPNKLYTEIKNGGNLFTTTIFVLVSAVQKMARVIKLPAGLALYRGLGGDVQLPAYFFKSDEHGCKGIVEWGFMSTTADKDVAIRYSGIEEGKPFPVIFEIRTGAVDRGANISEFSQYPQEQEYLFVPCSFLEPQRSQCLEITSHGVVTKIHVRLNSNLRTHTTEELMLHKKQMHVSSFRSWVDELKIELTNWCEQEAVIAKVRSSIDSDDASAIEEVLQRFVESIVDDCLKRVKDHDDIAPEKYQDDDFFRSLVIESLEVKEMAKCKFQWWLQGRVSITTVQARTMRRAQRECIMILERELCTLAESNDPDEMSKRAVELCKKKGLVRESVDEVNDMGEDCLHAAAATGASAGNLKLLVQAKADVHSKSRKDGATALMLAALNGHPDAVTELCALKADVNAQKKDGTTALIWAAQNGHSEVVKVLVDLKALVNISDKSGRAALIAAASWGHFKTVEKLVTLGANVNAQQLGRGTALIIAAQQGEDDAVRYLLQARADAKYTDARGQAAIDLARTNGHWKVVKTLSEEGAGSELLNSALCSTWSPRWPESEEQDSVRTNTGGAGAAGGTASQQYVVSTPSPHPASRLSHGTPRDVQEI